jgi:hypothetical protein
MQKMGAKETTTVKKAVTIRFSDKEITLLLKIIQMADRDKRSLSAQIKFLLSEKLEKK